MTTDPRELPVPQHTLNALNAYISRRIPTGDFCRMVLENNLKLAISYADSENMERIPAIVYWLYNNAPSGCWGSPERVAEWLEGRQ